MDVLILAARYDAGAFQVQKPTCTCPDIWHQGIAITAAALIAAFWVSTVGVTASIHYHALINIWGSNIGSSKSTF